MGQIDPEQYEPILGRLRRRRHKAQIQFKRIWSSTLWKRLIRLEHSLLRNIQESPKSSELFGAWSAQALRKFAVRFRNSVPKERDDVVALHRFRIRVKNLRYVIELLVSAFPDELESVVYPMIESLQDRLGLVNDCCIAKRTDKSLRSSHSKKGAHKEWKKNLEAQGERLKNQLKSLHEWWTPENQHQLFDALARMTRTPFRARA
jgi:CHAD domain-containing protein